MSASPVAGTGTPLLQNQKSHCTDMVQKVALDCLKEFVISFICTFAICCFVPSPAGVTLLFHALFAQLITSIFFHTVGAYARQTRSISEWLIGANFAALIGFNTQKLVHESGHALAALAVYRNPRPQIFISPFSDGFTQYRKRALTTFGKAIGPAASTCFFIASGPGFTLLISAVLLLIGLSLKDRSPQLSKYLICYSLIDFLDTADYAYKARWADPVYLVHDFVHLSVFGLKPLTATIGIIAIPILIFIGSKWAHHPSV